MKPPLHVVCDGSYSDDHGAQPAYGVGYITITGEWGAHGAPYPDYHFGKQRTQVAELYAVMTAAEWVHDHLGDGTAVIHTDSHYALRLLRRWATGRPTLPDLYQASYRGETTPLENFRRWVHAHADTVTYAYVRSHNNIPLQTGAHWLAVNALRVACGTLTQEEFDPRAAQRTELALTEHLGVRPIPRSAVEETPHRPNSSDELLAELRGVLMAMRDEENEEISRSYAYELYRAAARLDTHLSQGGRLPKAWRH